MHQKGITESNPRKNTKSEMSYTCIHSTFVFTGRLKKIELYGVLLMS